jgi:hypothetical protein
LRRRGRKILTTSQKGAISLEIVGRTASIRTACD